MNTESPTERQILAYLARCPHSQDTFRGIVEWWLLKQRIVHVMTEVKRALMNLVAKGKIGTRVGSGGEVRFRLKRRRVRERPAMRKNNG
jgi:hypothetical protein